MGLEGWDADWMSRQSLSAALGFYTKVTYTGQARYPQRIRDLFGLPKCFGIDGVKVKKLPGWMNTNFEDAHCHGRFSRKLKRDVIYRRLRNGNRGLLLWHPSLISYLDCMSEDVSCYYVVDFFEGLVGSDEYLDRLREQESLMLKSVDVVFVTWKGLAEKLGLGDKAVILPHGVNFEYYNRASRNEFPTPADIPRGRPIVGYSGSIKTKTDFDLLEKMTQRLADWNIVLIGVAHVEKPEHCQKFENLRRQSNFFHLGLKSHDELGAYLQSFDVCMMCYTINEWTEYGLPLKMLEYFATGKPVVSTYLPSLEDYRDYVTVCENHDDFISAVAAQGSLDTPERRNARIAFAARNTWKDRARTILQVMGSTMSKKKR